MKKIKCDICTYNRDNHDNNEDNHMEDIHEYCEMGNCILCEMHINRDTECSDFKDIKEVENGL